MEPLERTESKAMRSHKHNTGVNDKWMFLAPMVNTTLKIPQPLLHSMTLMLYVLTAKNLNLSLCRESVNITSVS